MEYHAKELIFENAHLTFEEFSLLLMSSQYSGLHYYILRINFENKDWLFLNLVQEHYDIYKRKSFEICEFQEYNLTKKETEKLKVVLENREIRHKFI